MKGIDNINSTITSAFIPTHNLVTRVQARGSEERRENKSIQDRYEPSQSKDIVSYSRPLLERRHNTDEISEYTNSTPKPDEIKTSSTEQISLEEKLQKPIRTAKVLKEVLSGLKTLTANDRNYKLEDDRQLKNFSATLNSRNFNQEVNLKEEVLDMLSVFKDRGSVLDGDIKKNIDIYYKKPENRNRHKIAINEFSKSSNSTVQKKFLGAMQYRAKLLSNMAKLSPESLSIKDIEEFIRLFGGTSKLEELSADERKLEQSAKDLRLTLYGADSQDTDYHNAFNQRTNTGYYYQALDITTIQNELMQPYLNRFTIHDPIGDGHAIDQTLRELLNSVVEDKPTLCVYNLGNFHWVTFAALKKNNDILILYKDSLGVSNPALEKKVIEINGNNNVQFIINTKKEQTAGVDCGLFALKNMEIIAKGISQYRDKEFNNEKYEEVAREGTRFLNKRKEVPNSDEFRLSKKARVLSYEEVAREEMQSLNKRKEVPNSDEFHLSKKARVLSYEEVTREETQFLNKRKEVPNSDEFSLSKKARGFYQNKLIQTFKNFSEFCSLEDAKKFRKGDFANKYVLGLSKKMSEENPTIQVNNLLENLYVTYDNSLEICNLVNLGTPNIKLVGADKLEQLQKYKREQLEEISTKKNGLGKDISNIQNKLECLKAINIDELIVLLAEKLKTDDPVTSKISSVIIDKLIETGRNTNDKVVALALLNILNFLGNKISSRGKELESVFNNILPKISQDNKENISLIKNIAKPLSYSSSLVEFMHKVLIKSKDVEARKDALELLKSCGQNSSAKLPSNIKRTIDLENYTCNLSFKQLLTTDQNNSLIDLLQKIATEHEELPELFIHNFKEFAKSFDYTQEKGRSELIRISKLLVKDGYISLEDIGDIVQLLDDETIRESILEIIRDEIVNQGIIDDSILAKVKEIASTDKKAKTIVNIYEKFANTGVGILLNPRKDLTERQKALEEINTSKKNHLPYVVDVLATIIKYEENLQDEAFKVLVSILPNDYSTKGFALDLEGIAGNIYDAGTEEILAFARKDKIADLSAIGSLLIERIIYGDNSAMKVLQEISGFWQGQKLIFNNLSSLLFLVQNAIDPSFKQDVVEIIENVPIVQEEIKKYIPIETWEKIKKGQGSMLDINVQNLDELKKDIEQGCIITRDIVSGLIANLSDDQYVPHYVKIADKLLQIDLSQGIDGKTGIYKAAVTNHHLIKLPSIVGLIANDLCNGIKVPEEIKSGLLSLSSENIDNKSLKYNLIAALEGLVLQGNRLGTQVLEQIGNLSNKEEDINLRIAISDIIAKEIKEINYSEIPKSIINQLQNVCLEDRKSKGVDLLNKIAFQALERSAKAKNLRQNFLVDYYDKFKERVVNLRQNFTKEDYLVQLKPLDKYILSGSNDYVSKRGGVLFGTNSSLDKFYLLSALNNTFLNKGEIDTTIFSGYHSSQWRREVLCSELLAKVFKFIDTKEGINEFELQDFRDNVSSCSKYVKKHSDVFHHYSIENILQKLIDHSLRLEDVNDILLMLQSDAQALDIIKSDSPDFLMELKELWLNKALNKYGIKFTTEELQGLNQYLPYRAETIRNVIFKTGSSIPIKNLTGFFTKLDDCDLDIEQKEEFLSAEIKNNSTPKDWLPRLNCKLTGKELSKKFANLNVDIQLLSKLQTKLAKFLDSNWLVGSVSQLIEIVNKDNIGHMLNALDPIYEYHLREYENDINGKELLTIFKESKSVNWQKELHDLAIFQIFKGSYDKNLDQLKTEIQKGNNDTNIPLLKANNLADAHQKIIDFYNQKSALCPEACIIKDWTEANIKVWASKVKAAPDNVHQYEKIAVVKKAVELTSKFPPREVQLLSLLIMLNPEESKGRLAQINTGEGKTTIVAMLAAIKALEGHKVDIVTSSPALAKPQSEEQSKFFEKFGFTVAHNGKDSVDIKERYKADILYGAANNFQGDILRDEYSKLGTRSGRVCDVAIVDEVDSMLIDGRNHIVMLSSPAPAMDHLEGILAAIWLQIEQAAESIIEKNGQAFFIEQEPILGEDGKVIGNRVQGFYPVGNKEQFIKDSTAKHIRKMIRDKDGLSGDDQNIPAEYPEIKIPNHLREFVTKVQLPKWIDSAITAKYRYELNKHYILEDGKILPVDSSNTGVVQQNMNWSNGLHQFLQIKHGTKITAESLTTNFISNVTYFKRYGTNIYGLTGTLGSDSARELLNITYDVDSIIIPPFRQKQYQELTTIVTSNMDDWYANIVDSSLNKLKNGRGVLVITKYMDEVDEIKNRLVNDGYDKSKIKIYKTESDSHVIEGELKAGEIIIATNIAGRGTDIKPSTQVEKNGGLHVCVTFMPPNKRVEQQNVGRTSRTGNKGSGQFILLEKIETNINKLKEVRDKNEEQALRDAKQEISRTIIKDKVFEEFCGLLSEIDPENKKNSDPIVKLRVKAIEDRFAIWLRMQEKETIHDKETLLKNYKKFRSQISDDSLKNQLVKNPYFHVLKGNSILDSDSENKYKEAIDEFTEATGKDPYFAANAYYNRGYARIAGFCGEKNWLGQKHDEYANQIKLAIDDFKEAKRTIEENLEPILNIIQKASYSEVLSEQVQHKLTLFGMQKNTIESAIGIGHEAMLARQNEEEEKLNVRIKINKDKIEEGEKKLANLDPEERKKQIIKFQKTLQEQRNVLIEQDIKDSIRATKIAKAEAGINERLKNARKREEIVVYDEGYPEESYEDVEEEKKALDSLKKGNIAITPKEKTLNSSLQPTNDEIKSRKEELAEQDSILEHGIIGHAFKKKAALEIEFIGIEKSLPEDQDASLYKDEINEYKNNGFKGSFQVTEIKPIDWWSVAGLAVIGLTQIVAGAALAVFTLGAGSTIGMGLISEGVGDLITAVKDGIINRSFDWTSYGIQKAISLTVSIACAGLGAIKDAAKTALAGVKMAAGTVKTGAKVVTQAVKEGWKIVAKAMGTGIAKGITKELVTDLVDYGVSKALMPSIRKEVMTRIEKPIQEALLENDNVRKMLELDGKNRNNYYQSLIKKKALEILNPHADKEHALLTITKGIAKGIANSKIKGLSTAMQLAEAMGALSELNKFVPEFIKSLNAEIEQLAKSNKIDEKLAKIKKDEEAKDKEEKANQNQNTKSDKSSHDSYSSQTYEPMNNGEDIDLRNGKDQEDQATLSENTKSPDDLKKALSSSISVNMCNIIQSKLVSPLTHAGIDYGMKKLTAGVDKSLEEAIGNYQAERRIEFAQNGDKDNRIPGEFKEGWDDKEAIANVAKADSMIDELKSGGEAGLPHLGALSDEAGRPIKILDEKGRHVRTIGGDKGGEPIEVQYHKPNPNNPSGHWTLPRGKDAPSSGGNNCLFDTVAAQTGKDPHQLRAGTAQKMENNKESLANQARDITRLEQYKKDALTMGGVRVYRVIRDNEDPEKGLLPRGNGNHSPRAHVAQGGLDSEFISTTTDLNIAQKWAGEEGRIVMIDTQNDRVLDQSTIDFTHQDIRQEHILSRPGRANRSGRPISNKRVEQDAIASKEVLFKGAIPPQNVKLIYSKRDYAKISSDREVRWGRFKERTSNPIWMKPSDPLFLNNITNK